jgi:hypothetical protein
MVHHELNPVKEGAMEGWTEEHMIAGTMRVEWDRFVNAQHGIEIHVHEAGNQHAGGGERITVEAETTGPYEAPTFTPEAMDALAAWWIARREAATAYQGA